MSTPYNRPEQRREPTYLTFTPRRNAIASFDNLVVLANYEEHLREARKIVWRDRGESAVDIHVLQGERELARDNRTLGQFRLEGIAPASRGLPQVEVTFDIDANGILNVTAKDMATGKEQKITISGSTSLDKNEIDRMLKDAEAHSAEDKARRELIEARNTADSLAYSVERSITDMGDRVPAHERARAESLISDIRAALKDESTSIDRWRQLTSDLQQVSHSLASAAYGQASAASAGAGGGSGSSSSSSGGGGGADDEVIDAEYTPK